MAISHLSLTNLYLLQEKECPQTPAQNVNVAREQAVNTFSASAYQKNLC